jgi:hypothetical protein
METVLKFTHHNYIFLIISILISIYLFVFRIGMIGREKNYPGHLFSISLVAMMYPIGKICQFAHLGPIWIRSWGADLGFVPSYALAGVIFAISMTKLVRLKYAAIVGTIIGFMLGISTELLQFYGESVLGKNLSGISGFTGRADIVDIITFTVSAIATIFFSLSVPDREITTSLQKKKLKSVRKH